MSDHFKWAAERQEMQNAKDGGPLPANDPMSREFQMKRMADKGWCDWPEFEKLEKLGERLKPETEKMLIDLDRKIHAIFDRRKA